jgi:NitT/TauT family transport system substrate-binding protein
MRQSRRDVMRGLVAATGLAAWGLPAGAQTPAKLRVGVLRLSSSGPVFIAQERGYFREAGLEVELKFFDAAQPIAVAVSSGDLDVGVTALTAGLFNLAHKGAIRILAGQSREAPGFPLIGYLAGKAAYEAGLRTPKDLGGHAVGMTQVGSSFHYSMGLLARKYGFDLAKTRLVPLQSMSNVASALKGGRVEAALLPATAAQPLIDSGDAKLIGWVGDETPWQLGGVFAGPAFIEKNRDVLVRFLSAYRKGTRDYHDLLLKTQQNGVTPLDETTRPVLAAIAKYVDLPPEKVAVGLAYVEPDAVLSVESIEDQIAFMQGEKLVDPGFKAAQVIDATFGYAK